MKPTLRTKLRTLLAVAAILLAAPRLLATPTPLTDHPVSDDASLRAAILAAVDGDTITFTNDITLTTDLPAVQASITIDGQNHTLSGDDLFRAFFIGKWTPGTTTQVAVSVTIQNLVIDHARAHGGNGGWGDEGFSGGGGAALGGAIFVADLAALTIRNVTLQNNTAEGGAGGVFSGQPGVGAGGGGMGGDGGHATFSFTGSGAGAGGGLGRGATGGKGNTGGAGSAGIATGAAPGGNGASGNPGGAAGGGGGSGTDSSFNAAAGGGVGGTNGVAPGSGGNGGFGGGGGGVGGNGGYGGGGGGGGGTGGFGGGGGAGAGGTLGGFGGGAGGATAAGGGAAIGGALFVQAGGTLTIEGNLTVDGNAVSGGPAVFDGVNGSAFGSGIFLAGNGTLTFNPGAGETQTVNNDIGDQNGNGGTGASLGAIGLRKDGDGTLVLAGTNTYTEQTNVFAGTLIVNGVTGLWTTTFVQPGATLGGSGRVGVVDIGPDAWLSPTGVLHAGILFFEVNGHLAIDLHGATPGSYDQVALTGPVSVAGAKLSVTMDFSPNAGTVFTIVDGGPDSVDGTFDALPDGSVLVVNGRHLRINYGNDVTLTVLQETPVLNGSAPASVTFGNSIVDGVTIANAFNPTGTVTFRAYGPADATCAAAPVFTSTTPVVAGSTLSGIFTPASAGVYRWTATYSGDVNNTAAATACGAAGQSTTITKANQTITFGSLSDRIIVNSPFDVFATASSSLGVTFISQTLSVCSVTSGGSVTLLALGPCTIVARQDGDGNYNAATSVPRTFSVLPNCAALSLSPVQLPAALAGRPYSQAIAIMNGAGPGTFTLGGTLPSGLTFTNGAISGTPSGRGAFPITVTATDANACQVSASFVIAISPERRIAAGIGGGASTVRTLTLGGTVTSQFDAYGAFPGGVSVAQGDVNGDGTSDIITGAGPGGGPHVKMFDGLTGAERLSFFAFAPSFTAGVEVATGDVTGDGIPEILVTGGCTAPFVVRAFSGFTGALVREYSAGSPVWSCGLHVAAGNFTGDGIDDIVVGSGGAGSPLVTVIDGFTGAIVRQFAAYAPGFTGGVYVAAGDITGDGIADIVTGAGANAGPHVKVFDGVTGNPIAGPLASFMAYTPAFTGGVRVAAGDLNGDGRAELITAAGPGGGPHVRVFDGANGGELLGFFAFDPAMPYGSFVAAPPPLTRMAVDLPAPGAIGASVRVAGWALRQNALDTTGTDAIHAWAYPVGGGAPVFVGATSTRVARSDVANQFGGEFLMSGFDFTGSLAPGTYDLVVVVRNARTQMFDQLRIVRVTVN